jgi:hypothetical protein
VFDLRESVLLQVCVWAACEHKWRKQVLATRVQAFTERRREKRPNPSFFECSGIESVPRGHQAGASRREITKRHVMGIEW